MFALPTYHHPRPALQNLARFFTRRVCTDDAPAACFPLNTKAERGGGRVWAERYMISHILRARCVLIGGVNESETTDPKLHLLFFACREGARPRRTRPASRSATWHGTRRTAFPRELRTTGATAAVPVGAHASQLRTLGHATRTRSAPPRHTFCLPSQRLFSCLPRAERAGFGPALPSSGLVSTTTAMSGAHGKDPRAPAKSTSKAAETPSG